MEETSSASVSPWAGVGPGGGGARACENFQAGIDLEEKPPGGWRRLSPSPWARASQAAGSERSAQKLPWDACNACGSRAGGGRGKCGLSDPGLSISEAGRNPERPVWTRKRNPCIYIYFRKWVILKELCLGLSGQRTVADLRVETRC